MEQPLITIGLACFNAQDTIERALTSALQQTWENKEILVVDDCSTDDSTTIIYKTMKEHSNIRIIRNEINRGVGFTRKTIVENAKGEFVAFFDDDDISLPKRLARQYDKIISSEKMYRNNKIVCHISGERRYPNQYTLPLNAIGGNGKGVPGKELADRLLFFKKSNRHFFGGHSPTCSMMAKKETFLSVGNFDPDLQRVEDVDISIRIGLAGGMFVGLGNRLFVQFTTDAPDKSPEKNMRAEVRIVEKHQKYLKEKGLFFYAKNWPLLRFYHFKANYIMFAITFLRIFLRHPIRTLSHAYRTFPKRILHEKKMGQREKFVE